MDIATLIVEALKFIAPAYASNATPVLAGGGTPMDLGKNFLDGKRLFGTNKTFRGFFFGWAVGMLIGTVEGFVFGFDHYSVFFSVFTPLGALLGDLTGTFIKRRLNIKPGGLLPVVDQVDFVVGALVFALPFVAVSWMLALTVLLLTPPVHLFTNFVAYKLKLKKHPW